MVRQITVSVQEDHLAKYARSPMRGIEELVWNAIDADAGTVEVVLDRNNADGLDAVHVRDDGHGMSTLEVEQVFGRLGGSWKLVATKSRVHGRPLHGRHGAGRYYAFGLHGSLLRWETVAEVATGDRRRTVVEGRPERMSTFVLEDAVRTDDPSGTTVSILGITEEPRSLSADTARDRLTATFALALAAHQIRITYDGQHLDVQSVLVRREDLDVPFDSPRGDVALTVIEWAPSVQVEPTLHLCTPGGASLLATSPGGAGARHRFTAYARWQGFHDLEQDLALDGLPHPELTPALDAVRTRLADYWRRRDAELASGYIEEWRAQQVYPYHLPPSSPIEAAEQELFGRVAVAAVSAVNVTTEVRARRYTLGLLREAVLSGPGSLRRVLEHVLDLPDADIQSLDELLRQTTLSSVIAASRMIADRLDFLDGLEQLVFSPSTRARLRERAQLHRMLESETWVFGEQFALTASDRTLDTVLDAHLRYLGRSERLPKDREADARRVDLMLARTMETRQPRYEHLVIELKRPALTLRQKEYNQITDYALKVAADERYNKADVTWEFILVANAMDGYVEAMARQGGRSEGEILRLPNGGGRVVVRTWAQVIQESRHRLKFVQQALNYAPTGETSAAYLNEKYSSILGDEGLQPN